MSEPVAPPHNDYVPMMKAKSEWDMGGTPPPRRGYTPTSRPTTVKSEDVFNARTSSALDTGKTKVTFLMIKSSKVVFNNYRVQWTSEIIENSYYS